MSRFTLEFGGRTARQRRSVMTQRHICNLLHPPGAASELIVYPLEVIRRKMQLQSMALAGLRLQTNTPAAAAASAAAAQSAATASSGAAAAATAAGSVGAAGAAGAAAAAAAAPAAAHGVASAAAGPGVVGGAMGHHGATSAAAAAAAAAGGRIAAAAAHAHAPPLPHGGALGHLAGAAHGHLLPPQALAALLGGGGGAGPASGLARIAAAVAAIIKADGPKGFYSGLLPNMLQVRAFDSRQGCVCAATVLCVCFKPRVGGHSRASLPGFVPMDRTGVQWCRVRNAVG